MGILTDDMTRLRGEVEGLRSDRESLLADVSTSVANLKARTNAMQEGFHRDHTEMATQLRGGLSDFIGGLKSDVTKMQDGFRDSHADMAAQTSRQRQDFTSGLQQGVAQFREEFAADLAGARRGWFGDSGPAPKAQQPEREETSSTAPSNESKTKQRKRSK